MSKILVISGALLSTLIFSSAVKASTVCSDIFSITSTSVFERSYPLRDLSKYKQSRDALNYSEVGLLDRLRVIDAIKYDFLRDNAVFSRLSQASQKGSFKVADQGYEIQVVPHPTKIEIIWKNVDTADSSFHRSGTFKFLKTTPAEDLQALVASHPAVLSQAVGPVPADTPTEKGHAYKELFEGSYGDINLAVFDIVLRHVLSEARDLKLGNASLTSYAKFETGIENLRSASVMKLLPLETLAERLNEVAGFVVKTDGIKNGKSTHVYNDLDNKIVVKNPSTFKKSKILKLLVTSQAVKMNITVDNKNIVIEGEVDRYSMDLKDRKFRISITGDQQVKVQGQAGHEAIGRIQSDIFDTLLESEVQWW